MLLSVVFYLNVIINKPLAEQMTFSPVVTGSSRLRRPSPPCPSMTSAAMAAASAGGGSTRPGADRPSWPSPAHSPSTRPCSGNRKAYFDKLNIIFEKLGCKCLSSPGALIYIMYIIRCMAYLLQRQRSNSTKNTASVASSTSTADSCRLFV